MPSNLAERVTIEIAGCVPGRYRLSIHRIGYRKNDIHTAFLGMKADGSLSFAQEKILRAESADECETAMVNVASDGCFRYRLELDSNEVTFLEIDRDE